MKKGKKKNYSLFYIAGISLLIGFLVGYIVGFRHGTRPGSESFVQHGIPSPGSTPPQTSLDLAAVDIARELNCICGKCNLELLPCDCDDPSGSKEIKRYVQKLVDEGLEKSDALDRLVEKYGRRILKGKL